MRDHSRARSAVDHVVDEAANGDQRLGLRHEAGADRERRQPAQAPSPLRELGDRVAQGREIATLQPVGQDDDRGAARVAAEARHGEKGLQRVTDAGAAVPIAHQMRGGCERLLAALEPQRARQARQPRAKGEDFDIRRRLYQRMREPEIVLRARFHRARDVDQQQHFARPRAALQPPEPHHLAVVAYGFAQGSSEVRPRSAPRAHAAMAAPARQARRGFAREPAQRVVRPARAEAALCQCLGADRHFA